MIRQIFFIGLSPLVGDRHRIEAMYELSKSDRYNFKRWFEEIRAQHAEFVITTNDEVKRVEAKHEMLNAFQGATYMDAAYVKRLNCRGAPYVPIRHCDDCDFFTRDQDVTICPHDRGHVG